MAKPMIAEKNAQKITADPIVTIEPSLPSLEELRFLGLIHPVLLDRVRDAARVSRREIRQRSRCFCPIDRAIRGIKVSFPKGSESK